jgi:hypothetical protein
MHALTAGLASPFSHVLFAFTSQANNDTRSIQQVAFLSNYRKFLLIAKGCRKQAINRKRLGSAADLTAVRH